MSIETILNESVIAAIKELYGQEIATEKNTIAENTQRV